MKGDIVLNQCTRNRQITTQTEVRTFYTTNASANSLWLTCTDVAYLLSFAYDAGSANIVSVIATIIVFYVKHELTADRGLRTRPASLRSRQRPHCSENKHSTWRQEFLGRGSENMEQSTRLTAAAWHWRHCKTTFKGISVWRDRSALVTLWFKCAVYKSIYLLTYLYGSVFAAVFPVLPDNSLCVRIRTCSSVVQDTIFKIVSCIFKI